MQRRQPVHPDTDVLAEWIRGTQHAGRDRARRRAADDGGLRFAFYGRISTDYFQDRASSSAWQRAFAVDVVAGHGTIVAEFFDIGFSRRLDWPDRPQAAALLAEMATPGRRFDAIVVGEFERAFYGDQFTRMAPLFDRHRIQVWLPEVNGPINAGDPTHAALMMLLGAQSKREVLRSRYRVTAAMSAQASQQGRHLGGRPPYGYRLVDAGPHPNRAHAEWGRRLHRLDPDPATERHVRWMFAQRLAGHSTASIARILNNRGVPCPSRVDPNRNPHRSGAGWTLRTVAAILGNPRYTGRQVWNRQRADRDLVGAGEDVLGCTTVHRWNAAQKWVISATPAHPALVSERTSSPRRPSTRYRSRTRTRSTPTCSSDCCAAGSATAYWTRIGPTAHRHTDAATATPAPDRRHPTAPRTFTYAKTSRSHSPPPNSAAPANPPKPSRTGYEP